MTDLRRLFEQELRALQEEGERFARDFPEAARFLDPASLDDRDPYVERITEAMAYLTGRLREVMDEADRDQDDANLAMLAPDLVQPLPSVSVVQFMSTHPKQDSLTIPAGAMVRSEPVEGAPEGIPFRLLHPVPLTSMRVASAALSETEKVGASLELKLAWTSQRGNHGWPDSLRFFLYGDAPMTWALRYALRHRVVGTEIWRGGNWRRAALPFSLPVLPNYTTENDMALPLTEARDFLCSDERFRFVELRGIASLGLTTKHTLRLRFHLAGPLPRGLARAVSAEAFRLHAGVVVNRSAEELPGVVWDHTRHELPIRPFGGSHREILQLTSVRGFDLPQMRPERKYRPYTSHDASDPTAGTFHLARRIGTDGQLRTFLGLGNSPDFSQDLTSQSLALTGVCGDGDHPQRFLAAEQISRPGSDLPTDLGVRGLVRPGPCCRMPDGAVGSMLSALMQGHAHGWLDAARLKDGLRHVLWDRAEAKRNLIETIHEIQVADATILVQGVAWRHRQVTIRLRDTTCTPETWDRLGLLDAFGSVLWTFVKNATPLGSRSSLRVTIDPAGSTHEYGDTP